MASKAALQALEKLDSASCQNLIQYSSSRARSIALTFVTGHKRLSEAERNAYLGYFTNELLVGVYVLGYAVVTHNGEITVPWALRKFVRALTQGRLDDISVLLETAGEHGSQTDNLLEFYVGDWWSLFGPTSAPPSISIQHLIETWHTQSRNLVTLGRRSVIDLANLSSMSKEELVQARLVAEDTRLQLERESEIVLEHISEVQKRFDETTTLSDNLQAIIERFSREDMEESIAGNPSST